VWGDLSYFQGPEGWKTRPPTPTNKSLRLDLGDCEVILAISGNASSPLMIDIPREEAIGLSGKGKECGG